MRNGAGESKGFGFVCFGDPLSAEKAVNFVLKGDQSREYTEKAEDQVKEVDGIKVTDLYVREAIKKE
jgi:hypothetical protein